MHKKLTWQLLKGHFVADLYYHLNEKFESQRKRFFVDSTYLCLVAKWQNGQLKPFLRPPSGRHSHCSDTFLPSIRTSIIAEKVILRPIYTSKKLKFCSFLGEFGLIRVQSGHVRSLILKLVPSFYKRPYTLSRLCHEGLLMADLYHHLYENRHWIWKNSSHFQNYFGRYITFTWTNQLRLYSANIFKVE